MFKKFVSLGDIRKSLHTLNETSCDIQDLNDVELTRSFFEWLVDFQYDLTTGLHHVDAWVKQDDQKKKYIERFNNGEFNEFLKVQSWAEQMEEGDT